jgi:SET domain-containing protein
VEVAASLCVWPSHCFVSVAARSHAFPLSITPLPLADDTCFCVSYSHTSSCRIVSYCCLHPTRSLSLSPAQAPSCQARICLVDGTHRIGIYARRDLEAGEEITFDYQMKNTPEWYRDVSRGRSAFSSSASSSSSSSSASRSTRTKAKPKRRRQDSDDGDDDDHHSGKRSRSSAAKSRPAAFKSRRANK